MDPILIALIGFTAIFSYKGFNDFAFFRRFEFHVGSIRAGDQIRILSSGFLHAALGHLLLNMLTLYFFAPTVIAHLGIYSFLLIYFGSLIFGSLLTLLFHKDDFNYRAIGASGAVTGVLYSAIMLEPDSEIGLYFIIWMPAYVFGIAYLLYSIYGMRAKSDNIGHTAHFGGAIGGYVITLMKQPAMFTDNTFIVVLLAIPIIILFILAKLGKI